MNFIEIRLFWMEWETLKVLLHSFTLFKLNRIAPISGLLYVVQWILVPQWASKLPEVRIGGPKKLPYAGLIVKKQKKVCETHEKCVGSK